MTPDQGLQRIIFHTQPERGAFLDMLRPYTGLRQDVLDDVLDALRACASKLGADNLQREFVCALWSISQLGRAWGLDPGGMLRRNNLISEADQGRLRDFLERFDYAVLTLLDGASFQEAFFGLGTKISP
jgi:hypothetical protein